MESYRIYRIYEIDTCTHNYYLDGHHEASVCNMTYTFGCAIEAASMNQAINLTIK